jgi:hypothetical protein
MSSAGLFPCGRGAFFRGFHYRCGGKYSILGSAMAKRKLEKFSVTKAVKSNARDQVGQPKPGRVVDDRPKPEGRKSKHKPSLEDVIEAGEEK